MSTHKEQVVGGSLTGLEHIFGSKTRVKLLSIFVNHPEQSFYVRELVRHLGMQINSVRRELANLSNFGILKSSGGDQTRGVSSALRKRYYQVNRDFIIYNELQSLLKKAELLLEQNLVRRISLLGDVKFLILCGVFVGEEALTDMLIVGKMPSLSLQKLLKRFENEMGYEVRYTLMSPEEFYYRKNITDRFLYSILEGKKIVMIDKTRE